MVWRSDCGACPNSDPGTLSCLHHRATSWQHTNHDWSTEAIERCVYITVYSDHMYSLLMTWEGQFLGSYCFSSLYFSVNKDQDTSKADLCYDLGSGIIRSIDFSKSGSSDSSEKEDHVDEDWKCGVGHTVELKFLGEATEALSGRCEVWLAHLITHTAKWERFFY